MSLSKIKNNFSKKTSIEQLVLLRFILGDDIEKFEYKKVIEMGYDRSIVTAYKAISSKEYNEKVDFISQEIDSVEKLEEINNIYPELVTAIDLESLLEYQHSKSLKFLM